MEITAYYVENVNRRQYKRMKAEFKYLLDRLFLPAYVGSHPPKKAKQFLPAVIAAKIDGSCLTRSKARPIGINFFILDIDGIPKDLPAGQAKEYKTNLDQLLEAIPYNHVRYRTVSYRADNPRYRVIFPVESKLDPSTYSDTCKNIASRLFPNVQVDSCSYNIKQLMFLPRASVPGLKYTNPHVEFKADLPYIDQDIVKFTLQGKTIPLNATLDPANIDSDNYDLLIATHNQPTDMHIQEIESILRYLTPECKYEQWRNVGLALKHEGQTSPDRDRAMEEVFLNWSRGDFHGNIIPPNFTTEEDTRAKYQSYNSVPLDPTVVPITLRSIQYEAAKNGYQPPPSSINIVYSQKLHDWVFLYGLDMFYNTELKVKINRSAFNAVFAHVVKDTGIKVPMANYLASSGTIENYYDILYVPTGKPEKSVTVERISYINSYRLPVFPPPVDEKQKVYSAINEIKDYLNITVWPGEAFILFDYLAHLNRRPEQRICWMPLLQGGQGVGKSFFVVLAQCSLGEQNVNIISSDSITSTFSSWSSDSQLNIIEELSISSKERRGAYNKIKQYITGDRINVNQKYLPERNITNRTSYAATTNLIDSIRPEQDDRRLFILNSPLSKSACKNLRDSNFFSAKFDILRANQEHVREYFLEYPVSESFKRIDLPFQTKGNKAIKKATRSPLAVKMDQIMKVYLENTKTISVEHVVFILERIMRYRMKRYDEQNITSVLLQEHGYRITDARIAVYGVVHDILTVEPHETEVDWEKQFREDLAIIKGNVESVAKRAEEENTNLLPTSNIFV